MEISHARVTRTEAAELAGVSVRQINRWSAAGLITVERDPDFRKPATYDPQEVMAAGAKWAERLRTALLGETDIAT